ncbi:ABC transporter ATP-binding protein [Comamonadaceae bacterium G21597-S1]|nr:ABC transporter ATP-binding protein [Comamonadaceae bacterium G21597-S1]
MTSTLDTLLEVRGLGVEFQTRGGVARVLDEVAFSVGRGQTLGLVGESGCGKSMTALAMMRLIPTPPGRITSGQVLLDGRDLLALGEPQMRAFRGNRISMIFQEPMTSLNPAYTVGDQIGEAVRLHQGLGRKDALARAVEMLEAVGIPAPQRRVREYPHQFSGGMRQRVMIAMALACKPDVLIADEPTTALDVTVQAQIFDLISELRERTETAVVLITHDMGSIAEMADRVAVMYAGRIVEEASVADLLGTPLHPYTQGLIACAPGRRSTDFGQPLLEIPGTVPSLLERRGGCAFADRCAQVQERCRTSLPAETMLDGGGRRVLCWLHAGAMA